jgi:hypothetical protein
MPAVLDTSALIAAEGAEIRGGDHRREPLASIRPGSVSQ